MSVSVEKQEKGLVKLTITVPAEQFKEAVVKSYNKNKGKYEIPGFRKGYAPQSFIEKNYGKVFYEDAVDTCMEATYADALKESGLDIVSKPQIDFDQVEEGKDFVYTAVVAVRPEVKLGDYKGIEVKKADRDVTDEELEKALNDEQEKNARLVTLDDAAAELKNIANINFEGFVDGKAFDGGKGEDYPLELGSGSFIPGFEDQVVGHKAGEEFDVNVTFPENYQAKELAGKAAVFKVKINSLKKKELPELDDEFASEVSEFDTFEEFKADVKKKLAEQKENNAKIAEENAAVDKVVELAEVELPDLMVETRIDDLAKDYAQRLQSQGMDIKQYFEITGSTPEQFRELLKGDAVSGLKQSLVLEAIAEKENVEVNDADVEEELQKMADAYGMKLEDIKKYMNDDYIDNIKGNLKIQKAVKLLVDNAVIK